jgi:aryl-alcohol dehydrogenase-like predicted oxidoreductase
MRRRRIGRSDLTVTDLALGTMTFGAETGRDEAHAQLDGYLEAGGNFIDTADVYGGSDSERIIGEWLHLRKPQGLVLATKGRFGSGAVSGASRRALRTAVRESLSRLGIETIDLYYIHAWDDRVPVEETVGVLAELVAEGVIRYVGWSNTTGWQLQRIIDAAGEGPARPIVFQPQYNLLDRAIEWEIIPACLVNGLGIAPWSPLGGGWLTGKYRRTEPPTGATRLGEDPKRGVEAYDGRNVERTWRILDAVTEIAHAHGALPGQVAIAWLLTRPTVTSILLGARTAAQLEQNLAAEDLVLAEDDVARLTRVSAPGLPPYPYGMIERYCGVTLWRDLGTSSRPAL